MAPPALLFSLVPCLWSAAGSPQWARSFAQLRAALSACLRSAAGLRNSRQPSALLCAAACSSAQLCVTCCEKAALRRVAWALVERQRVCERWLRALGLATRDHAGSAEFVARRRTRWRMDFGGLSSCSDSGVSLAPIKLMHFCLRSRFLACAGVAGRTLLAEGPCCGLDMRVGHLVCQA